MTNTEGSASTMTKEIPLLTADDIECRVQSVSKAKSGRVGAVLLIYKDARVDMKILDQVYGPTGWQRTHEVIDGTLYCNIDLWDPEKRTWVRKQDAGVESNTEKEKGRASDAFKRAGFNVGIGRELYSAPFIWIQLNEGEYYSAGQQNGRDIIKVANGVRFEVQAIGYDDQRRINELVIVDNSGTVRYTMRPAQQPPRQATAKEQQTTRPATESRAEAQQAATEAQQFECEDCGKVLGPAVGRNGKLYMPHEIARISWDNYGHILCPDCQSARKTTA